MKTQFALCAVLMVGCGTADPLLGTWRSTDIGQFATVYTSQNQTITFEAGKKLSSSSTVAYVADAGAVSKCVEKSIANGVYALSGSADNQTLVFTYTDGTYTRTDCKDPTQNTVDHPLTDADLAASNTTGGKIVISGTTFSLTNNLRGVSATYTFLRQ